MFNTNRIIALEQRIEQLERQLIIAQQSTANAHKRVDQHSLRTDNIEHYIGLRSHSFENGGRQWNYNQIASDIATGQRPESQFMRKKKRKHSQLPYAA